jgi:hypothetical protein
MAAWFETSVRTSVNSDKYSGAFLKEKLMVPSIRFLMINGNASVAVRPDFTIDSTEE